MLAVASTGLYTAKVKLVTNAAQSVRDANIGSYRCKQMFWLWYVETVCCLYRILANSTGSLTRCENHGARSWPRAKFRSRKIIQAYSNTKTDHTPHVITFSIFWPTILFSLTFCALLILSGVHQLLDFRFLMRSSHQNWNYSGDKRTTLTCSMQTSNLPLGPFFNAQCHLHNGKEPSCKGRQGFAAFTNTSNIDKSYRVIMWWGFYQTWIMAMGWSPVIKYGQLRLWIWKLLASS
jgi:hypothetical protein